MNACQTCLGRHGTLCGALDDEAVARLRSQAQDETIQRGRWLVHPGDPTSTVFMLRSGYAHTARVTREGKRQILWFMFPGDFFGITHEQRYAYGAWADTDAESDAIEGLLERLPIAPGHLCEQGGANYDSTDVMLSADGEDGLENRIVLSVTSLADGSALISTTGTAAGARIRPRIFRVNEAGAVTVIETGLGATQDDGAFVARRPDGTLYLGTLDGRLFRGTLEQGFVSFGPHLTMRQDGDRHESMYDFEIVPDQEAFWVVSHIRGPRLRRADSASVVELDDDLGFLELSLFNAPSGELLLTTVDNRPLRRIHWSEGTLLASANDVLPAAAVDARGDCRHQHGCDGDRYDPEGKLVETIGVVEPGHRGWRGRGDHRAGD